VLIGSGWRSNSKYSLLGAYRGVAQVISYEVRIAFLFVSLIITYNTFSIININIKSIISNIFILCFISILILVSILAETNRSPFDFAEGESELVSGFNVEYGSAGFAVLFIAEYGNIYFMSWLFSVLFLNYNYLLGTILIVILILMVRGVYPRFRYDKLIIIA